MGRPTGLHCARCGQVHEAGKLWNLCACGGPLLVDYDLARLRAEGFGRSRLEARRDMWRYLELLPVASTSAIVSLGEGGTPLLPLPALGRELGLPGLMLKDEGLNPTGSFKSRGAAAGVSMALALGARHVALPTAGNAGGAWAAYCARAGLGCTVVMPADTPEINLLEAQIAGAKVYLVRGLISDAGKIVARAVARHGWFDGSTLKEPYRIEGKKTMGYEIAEQCDFDLPDAILYPAGGGVGLIGIWKAFSEMETLGWIGARRPKLIAVQAAGCAPIVRAFEAGESESRFWDDAATVASGLRVPKALGDFLVLRAIRETNGVAIAADDAAIVTAMRDCARREGLFLCPEGAANLAVLPELLRRGVLHRDDRVVLLNTGTGLKYPAAVPREPFPLLEPTSDLELSA